MKQPEAMTDIVESLRKEAELAADEIERFRAIVNDQAAAIVQLDAENKRLREEVATWRSRYEAERKDHEATMKAWDEERSGL